MLNLDRRSRAPLALGTLLALGLCGCQRAASPPAAASPAALEGEDQKTLYAMGAMLGRNVTSLKLGTPQLENVVRGFRDAAEGKPLGVELNAYQMQVQQLFTAKRLEAAQAEKAKGKTFAEAAAKESGAETLASGVVYRRLSPGQGPKPKATDAVSVHYEGKFVDGKVFDNSRGGPPREFQLGGVIRCWTEGLQQMQVGEKARLVCPSDTAYGDQGRGEQMPGGATLVFDVELLSAKPGSAPAAPRAGQR